MMALSIAVCGIDGAGKSTLARMLGYSIGAPIFRQNVWQRTDDIESNVALSDLSLEYIRHSKVGQDLSLAYLQDFEEYRDSATFRSRPKQFISDRWTVCVEAFIRCFTSTLRDSISLSNVWAPIDLILYLDVAPTVAHERISKRGLIHWNERLEFLHAYREAYMTELQSIREPFVIVDANESEANVLAKVLDVVARFRVSRTPSAGNR